MSKDKSTVNEPVSLTVEQLKPLLHKAFEDEEMLLWLRRLIATRGGDCTALEQELKTAQADNARLQGHLHDREGEARKAEAVHAQQTREFTQIQAKLSQQLQSSERDRDLAKAQFEALKQQGRLPVDLAGLLARVRGDAALVQRFRLNLGLEETELLVQVVAVLSQAESFKRLWDLYKSRCEEQRTALKPEDKRVLAAALSWHNANWPDKPFEFSELASGDRYDYEQHLRPPAMSGEKIVATWLPGVPGLKLKPLVATQ